MKRLLTYIIIINLLFIISAFGQQYVLVHGWLGDGGVWDNTGVKSLIESEMASNVYQPSLTGTASSNSQAINLSSFLVNNSIDDAVAVSFSMGAMNTRRDISGTSTNSLYQADLPITIASVGHITDHRLPLI